MGPLVETVRAIFGRLRLLVSFGRILYVDRTTPLTTYTLEGFLGELRSQVPHLGTYGFQSDPPVGAQALMLAVGGDRGNLVVTGTEDRNTRPALLPYETQVYTAGGPVLRAITNAAGDALSSALVGKTVAVGDINITTTVIISGENVTISTYPGAGTVAISGATVTINGLNFSTHTHHPTTGLPQ